MQPAVYIALLYKGLGRKQKSKNLAINNTSEVRRIILLDENDEEG